MAIQRPVKQGGTRSYVEEVAADSDHLVPIYARDVDADLDTVYTAWNGGMGTNDIQPNAITGPKIKDGEITQAKLGPNAVNTAAIAPGAVTDAKIASVAWSKITGAPAGFPPSGVASGRLTGNYPGPGLAADVEQAVAGNFSGHGVGDLYVGTPDQTYIGCGSTEGHVGVNHPWAPQNTGQSSWAQMYYVDGNDAVYFWHRNAGAAAGNVQAAGVLHGNGTLDLARFVRPYAEAGGIYNTIQGTYLSGTTVVYMDGAWSDPGSLANPPYYVKVPAYANTVVVVSGQVRVNTNTGFGIALALEWYNPSGGTWDFVASQASASATQFSVAAVWPVAVGTLFRLSLTNATGGNVTIAGGQARMMITSTGKA